MTTFNKTITNSVNLFGPQDTNKWGAMTWGVDNWAYSQFDLPTIIEKLITNSLSLDSLIDVFDNHLITIDNAMILSGDMYVESLIDSNGYYKVFGVDTNAENRPLTSYNNLSDPATSYATLVDPGTTYTQIN